MHKILNKQIIANNIKRIEVFADTIARKAKSGQFVLIILDEVGDRISLPIVDADPSRGIITLIFEEINDATKRLGAIQIGSLIPSILGPLGTPTDVKDVKVVACVGYGIGIAQLLSVCRIYRNKKETKVVGIIGAKTKKSLVLESQMRMACHKLFVATDDGTYERRGLISDLFRDLIKKENIGLVYAAGSVAMMESVTQYSKDNNIESIVTLNLPVVDGIGICGSCRINVAGREVFACVDGPQFKGSDIDFKELTMRMGKKV